MHKNDFTSGRWKDVFAFTRRERRGIAVLIFILFAECAVLTWLHYLSPPANVDDAVALRFRQTADSFYAAVEADRHRSTEKSIPLAMGETEPAPIKHEKFDPNTLDSSGWRQHGIDMRTILAILHYRQRGGRFRTKEDVKKMYGLSPSQYASLEPWIHLPDSVKHDKKHEGVTAHAPATVFIDIGMADTTELLRIRGVGFSFARRINAYRERLGGFYSTAQLREVYGMSDSLFGAILPQIFLGDTSNLRKIHINTAGYSDLRKHPYIGPELATLMIRYRSQHGAFHDAGELLKIPLVTGDLCRKLAPYLSME